ncbi:Hypothetical predicted protein [Olea europaea subsp. europaea]|uniref:Uncharacterized protein n=1 Tax=Olea europaea subsp. europaea TaxID=158383 RepID=A0A8S0REH4_OLEEU|nr:Hypothetical predicted protein [Olea europaea subsp. europaea]
MDSGRENNVERGVGLRDENIHTLEDEELSVDGIFENEEVPSWTEQLTIRAFMIMIIDLKLAYPSGTASGHFINSFHALGGAKAAK